jgi:hypothetical protein
MSAPQGVNGWMDDEWIRNTFPSGSSSIAKHNGVSWVAMFITYQPTTQSPLPTYLLTPILLPSYLTTIPICSRVGYPGEG